MAATATLPGNQDLKGVLTVRKGAIEGRPRGGPTKDFSFTVEERFGVLRAKILACLEGRSLRDLRLHDDAVYFKAIKGAAQQNFVVLNDDNFVEMLTQRVKRVSAKEKEEWGDDVLGNLQFEFFIYCRLRVETIPTTHRATGPRMRAAAEAVQEYQREREVELGPITLNHVTTTHARQPDGVPFAMPSDNTTRQVIALDAAISEVGVERARSNGQRIASIRMEINGAWANFRVDVVSLRAALGLPAHDIFSAGIYHGFEPVSAPAVDLEDVDHISALDGDQ